MRRIRLLRFAGYALMAVALGLAARRVDVALIERGNRYEALFNDQLHTRMQALLHIHRAAFTQPPDSPEALAALSERTEKQYQTLDAFTWEQIPRRSRAFLFGDGQEQNIRHMAIELNMAAHNTFQNMLHKKTGKQRAYGQIRDGFIEANPWMDDFGAEIAALLTPADANQDTPPPSAAWPPAVRDAVEAIPPALATLRWRMTALEIATRPVPPAPLVPWVPSADEAADSAPPSPPPADPAPPSAEQQAIEAFHAVLHALHRVERETKQGTRDQQNAVESVRQAARNAEGTVTRVFHRVLDSINRRRSPSAQNAPIQEMKKLAEPWQAAEEATTTIRQTRDALLQSMVDHPLSVATPASAPRP